MEAFNYLVAFIVSFAISALLGLVIIPFLRRLKFGQSILEIGPKWHMSKQGTPIMGGIIFIMGTTAVSLSMYVIGGFKDHTYLYANGFSLIMGLIGFIDDYSKIRKKQNQGLTSIQKLLLQLSASAAFLAALRMSGYLTPNVFIPLFNVTIPVLWVVYIFFAIIYISGFINAVNLTDGVDGLATGVTIPVCLFFALLSYIWRASLPQGTGLFAAALCGGLFAFLIYNFNPAKVFMGDTGSLYLGGAICSMAFLMDIPLILIPIGFIYLTEMFSVMLQVIYFKMSKGRRLFRMAPIHHHFEMGGWSEKKLFCVFSGLTLMVCVFMLWSVAGRYMI